MSSPENNTEPDEVRNADEPDSSNPYTPPLAAIEVLPREALDAQFPNASNGKRFLNYLMDRVAIFGFAIVFGAAVGVLEQFGIVTGWLDWLNGVSRLEDILFTAVLSLVYYISLESMFGRTLGKLVTGTKVITVEGTKPRFLQVVGRSLARIVPFEPFSFLGDGGWHDRWSDTRVVDLRDKEGRDAMRRLSPQLAKLYRK